MKIVITPGKHEHRQLTIALRIIEDGDMKPGDLWGYHTGDDLYFSVKMTKTKLEIQPNDREDLRHDRRRDGMDVVLHRILHDDPDRRGRHHCPSD